MSAVEAARIREVQERWCAAAVSGDAQAMAALCTGDVVMQPPIGPPVSGPEAVAGMLGAAAVPERVHLDDQGLEIRGDVAISRARYASWLPDRGTPVTGWQLWLLRPRWRIAFLTWSLEHLPE